MEQTRIDSNLSLDIATSIIEPEKLIKTILTCSKIIADNDAPVITQWALIKTDGTRLVTSGHHSRNDSWKIDLDTDLSLEPGTQFQLKALVEAGDDSTSVEVLEYMPSSNVAEYRLDGNAFNTYLTLTSLSPFIYPCRYVYAYNSSATATNWALLFACDKSTVDEDTSKSDPCIFDLGTYCLYDYPLILKALVESGEDISSDIQVLYNKTSTDIAYFELRGNVFDPLLIFYGNTDPTTL